MDLQQIPLVAAAVEADAPLGIADELELSRLQLEVVHIELLVHTAGVEQELVGGDGEERPGQLPDPIHVKVLQILAGQDHGGLFLPYPLKAVADVFDGGQVAQPDIKLVQPRRGIALGKQLVAEIGQHIEQQGVFHIPAGLEEPLDAEDQKAGGGDVGVAVEELALRAPAHGVETQQDLLQPFPWVEGILLAVIVSVRLLDHVIEIGEDWIIPGRQGLEVGIVVHAPLDVQPPQHQLNGINMLVCKILIGPEEVLEERDMLAEPGLLAECSGSIRVIPLAAVVP